jgi:septal ring factor EnvC (AmiA/AmiB activator)
MRRRGYWFLASMLFVAGATTAQSIDDERRALADAKVQSHAADERAAALDRKAATERDEAAAVRARSAAFAARVQAAEADIGAAEARIRLIEQLRAAQRARLAVGQEPAVRLLAAIQSLARRPPLLALAQPGSVRDLVRTRAMFAAIAPEVHKRTAALREEVARGKQLRADADRAVLALNASKAKLADQQAQLDRLEAQHRAVAQRLQGGVLVEQDRAIAMGEKARDIVELMDRMGETATLGAQLATLDGPLLRPQTLGGSRAAPQAVVASGNARLAYRLPVAGTIVTGLGEVSGAGVRARGLTIATRNSAQLVAPAAGRIVFAGPYRGFGQIVIIDHGQGWTTLLTSLAQLQTRVGDNVSQGSPIGRAGNDRPTITIELRRGSQPVDIPGVLG